MSYRLVTDEERGSFAPELMGTAHILVSDNAKFWIVKQSDGLKRELLGYLLGEKVANVAEVKKLSPEEHNEIKTITSKDESSTPENTFLVRVAGSYSKNELHHKTPEKATAAELIFSTWIRRRDTHVDNRVYVEGVPIFYDHGAGFLWEPQKSHATLFFNADSDYGHASFWRVKEAEGQMTTQQARSVNRFLQGAHHFVNNLEEFKKELVIIESHIQEIFSVDFKNEVLQAGFDGLEAHIIYSFLVHNLRTLSVDLILMKEVIFKT